MVNPLILTALFLLFLPVGLLLTRSASLTGFERGRRPKGWNLFVLLVDPLRAGVGAWCFQQGMGSLVERIGQERIGEAALLGGVFAAGVLIQTLSRRDEDYVFAPFGYAAGVLLFFTGPLVAGPALALGMGSAAAMRAWTPFFMGTGAVTIVLGSALAPDRWATAVAIGLACLLPPLVALLAGRHMGFPRD